VLWHFISGGKELRCLLTFQVASMLLADLDVFTSGARRKRRWFAKQGPRQRVSLSV